MKTWPANLLTSGNLLCGFLSILLAIDGHPQIAGWLIFFASVLDAFDGKIARLLGGSTKFGLEFDSLADMVSFGVAPGVLIYQVAFCELEAPGLVVAAIPVLFTAIRLARFNVNADDRAHDFTGLSSPLHAGLIASFVVMSYAVWGEIADSDVLAGLVLLTSILMVSRFPFPGLPRLTLREPGYNLVKVIFLILAMVFMAWNPPRHTFPAIAVVVSAGFVTGALKALLRRASNAEDEAEEDEDDDEPSPIFRGRR
ncbi:CDP-diacylglycerol--serine O-phosphatidyltransferase [candidate division KSB1 bacterium]|nr:MAG: CDP-diacylglycerol--serine O-phosphatidyltransferase [candidate division KSB1 bacterium]